MLVRQFITQAFDSMCEGKHRFIHFLLQVMSGISMFQLYEVFE